MKALISLLACLIPLSAFAESSGKPNLMETVIFIVFGREVDSSQYQDGVFNHPEYTKSRRIGIQLTDANQCKFRSWDTVTLKEEKIILETTYDFSKLTGESFVGQGCPEGHRCIPNLKMEGYKGARCEVRKKELLPDGKNKVRTIVQQDECFDHHMHNYMTDESITRTKRAYAYLFENFCAASKKKPY